MDISKENLFSFQGMNAGTGGGLDTGAANVKTGGANVGSANVKTGGGKLAGKFSFIAGSGKFSMGAGNELSKSGITFKRELSKAAQNKPVDRFEGLNFAHHAKLESVKIDKHDAQFFLGLLEKNGVISSFNINQNGDAQVQQSEKSSAVSKALMDLLYKANDTKKPVRIDFDNNITLILRVNADGKISAQFFPGDKAAEEYLRNNIPYLKQQFEQKEISYSSINYHQRGQQGKQKEKQEDE